jgi:hypothetical protein
MDDWVKEDRVVTTKGPRCAAGVMDFDHVRGEKTHILARLRTGRLAWSRLLDELEKCELVCSNCHRIRTQLRMEGREIPRSSAGDWLAVGYVVVPLR